MAQCEHNYIVISWNKTINTKSARELFCTKCLNILDYEDLLKLKERKNLELNNKKSKD